MKREVPIGIAIAIIVTIIVIVVGIGFWLTNRGPSVPGDLQQGVQQGPPIRRLPLRR